MDRAWAWKEAGGVCGPRFPKNQAVCLDPIREVARLARASSNAPRALGLAARSPGARTKPPQAAHADPEAGERNDHNDEDGFHGAPCSGDEPPQLIDQQGEEIRNHGQPGELEQRPAPAP